MQTASNMDTKIDKTNISISKKFTNNLCCHTIAVVYCFNPYTSRRKRKEEDKFKSMKTKNKKKKFEKKSTTMI